MFYITGQHVKVINTFRANKLELFVVHNPVYYWELTRRDGYLCLILKKGWKGTNGLAYFLWCQWRSRRFYEIVHISKIKKEFLGHATFKCDRFKFFLNLDTKYIFKFSDFLSLSLSQPPSLFISLFLYIIKF